MKITQWQKPTWNSGGSRISRREGVDLVGGADSRGGYVSKILYVEMKEFGPFMNTPFVIIWVTLWITAFYEKKDQSILHHLGGTCAGRAP